MTETVTLYPRINIPHSDPREGEPRTPLGIPPFAGSLTPETTDDDFFISVSQANLAAAGSIVLGATVPNAPGERLLPFWLETKGVVHLRIAFLGDPNVGASPPSSLANTKVALVPSREIGAEGLVVDDSILPINSDWLTVGNTTHTKTVPGAYAVFHGSALDGLYGNIMPLTLTVSESAPADAVNATWFLVIKSDIHLWVTFAVSEDLSDTAEDVKLPWIHVPAANATVELTGGPFSPGSTTSPAGGVSGVCNFGPGDLVIAASTTSPSDLTDSVHVLPATIVPAGSSSVQLGYTAQSGLSGLLVDLESNDPTSPAHLVGGFHNARISVHAETTFVGIADTVLVLDASGSMGLRPDGWGHGNELGATPAARRRWDNLVTAADHLAFGYTSFLMDEAGGVGRLGVAVFPDVLGKATPGWATRAAPLVPSATVSEALRDEIHAQLLAAGSAIEGVGLTPMGDGIGVGMGTTDTSTGMFEPLGEAHRRWMVLMTDGAHNAGTVHPNQFYLPDSVGDFIPKQVRLYAIGYTTAAGGTAVSLLQDLAANAFESPGTNESQYVSAPVTNNFEKDLTDTFLDAMAASIGLTPSYDPAGTLSANSPVAIHEFHLSPYDTGVGIFVDWHSRDAERIHLTLISPRRERFEQRELEQRKEFQFRALSSSSHAYISRAALAGDENGSRYGSWKLELRLRAQVERKEPAAIEPYKFSIFNRSGLRLLGGATQKRWATGRPIELVMRLQAHGSPVSGARMVANVDAPSADFGSLLAGATVEPQVFERMLGEQKRGDQLGPWALKAQAIALGQGPIQVSRARRELVFHEGPPGEYRAKLLHTGCGGVYTTHVVATGDADGIPYRRERAVVVNVEAFPDPKQTIVTYSLEARGHLTVHVRPRDANGNPVIFEPSVSPLLEIEVGDAKPVSDVVNQLDGTYTRTFVVTGGRPEVIVIYDGEVIVRPRPLPDPRTLRWMERVVAYGPHCLDDPKKALGPVKGLDDPTVQVAAGASLELAAAGRHLFATHLAVFTDRSSTQPYRVYAKFNGKRLVLLGVGHGPTELFEVPGRFGPVRSILIQNPRQKGDPVLVAGVGYTVRKSKLEKLVTKLGFC